MTWPGSRGSPVVLALGTGMLVLLWLAAGPAAARQGDDLAALPPPFPYATDFDDHLLHVHPLVNYAPHPEWEAAWERRRLGRGGLLGTFGSSATDELMTEARWALNPDLGGGLRLRNDILWHDRRHLPHDRRQIWLGLEQRLWRGLGAVVQAVPAEDKERVDLRLGAMWASRDRTRYLQVLYRHDDLVYEEKNARDGISMRTPRGIDWVLRWQRGAWSLFSRGRWLAELAREYPDAGKAPVIAAHAQASNEALVRLRWQPHRPGRAHLELSWLLAEDGQRRRYRGADARFDHDFAGRFRLLSARGLVPLDLLLPVGDRWRARLELHHLARRATVSGYRAFHHAREEVLHAVYAEWRPGARPAAAARTAGRRGDGRGAVGSEVVPRTGSWLELGYLGTWFDRRDTTLGDASGYGDKLELGVVLGLARGSAFKVSLSQEVSEGSFGGGNLRLIVWF